MADSPRHPLDRGGLRRHDEVRFVLTVAAIAHEHRLALSKVLESLFDKRNGVHRHARPATMRSTYFAMTSTSTLTFSPTSMAPKVVSARVVGMSDTVALLPSRAATVRETPLSAIEPLR